MEEDLKGFTHICAWWPSGSCDQHYANAYLKPYIKNLALFGQAVSEKSKFLFSYVNDHTFINSISFLHLHAFMSQAAIVSENSTVFTFSYRKPLVTKFDLAVK